MTVAVIGPTNIERVGAAAGIAPEHLRATSASVGARLAVLGHALVVVPDRGVALAAALAYRETGGRELIGIAPTAGPSEHVGREAVADTAIAMNLRLCDVVVQECTWFEQHHTIGRLSDRMVCVGLSPGTLAELAWTKWTPGPPTALIAGTSSPPPPELLAETPTTVIALASLEEWLAGDARPLAVRT